MKDKIEQVRNSAKAFEVGDANDQTPVRFVFGTRAGLYVVKDKSIFLTQLADHIDPARTNIGVRDVIQKALPYGFESSIVGKILVSGDRLFNTGYMRDSITQEAAMEVILRGTGTLCDMQDLTDRISAQISGIVAAGIPYGDKGQLLPHTSDLRTSIDTYIRLTNNLRQVLIDFLVAIYKPPKGKRLLEHLKIAIHQKHGGDHGFCAFFDELTRAMGFMRELRNAWEHPKTGQRVVWKDFSMKPDGQVYSPTLEVISTEYPQGEIDVVVFMKECTAALIGQLEMLIGEACAANGSSSGFECRVVDLPVERRQHPEARLAYAVLLDRKWQPIG